MPKNKRDREEEENQSKAKKSDVHSKKEELKDSDDGSDIEFEDAFPDDYESEEEIENDAVSDGEDEGEDDEDGDDGEDFKVINATGDEEYEEDEENEEIKVWRQGVDKLEEGEVLEADYSAYDMLHDLGVEWPFLTFGFLKDELGDNRTNFPHTMHLIAGTQAAQSKDNYLSLLKISNICKTKTSEDSDDDESDSDDDSEYHDSAVDPTLEEQRVPVDGALNRLKILQTESSTFVATWTDTGVVSIFDVSPYEKSLKYAYLGKPESKFEKPVFTTKVHKNEGFALDWSPKTEGRLISGDCSGIIQETIKKEAGFTTIAPYKSHTASVEDLQWSSTETDVFASCSVDKTIKIWDSRSNKRNAVLTVKAHTSDVNTISWSKKVTYLLASGSDDSSFKIWDLRKFDPKNTIAEFTFHSDAISCVEWNPHDETQLIVASYDNQVTIWDMSLELDDAEELNEDYPPQLFFIHQGQTEVKDVHWHSQIPHAVVSSSAEGLMVWKASNSTEVPNDDVVNNNK